MPHEIRVGESATGAAFIYEKLHPGESWYKLGVPDQLAWIQLFARAAAAAGLCTFTEMT